MGKERFKRDTSDSFFGRFLYEQVVPEDHFLVKLKEIIPWQRFTYKLVKYYRGKAKQGRPPYDPAVLLKMLLVSYLYNISERQTEEVANLNLAVKYFLGLGVNEHPPDHSTLSAFKRRILENGKLAAFEGLLIEIVRLAQEKGIQFGSIQVIDSVHTVADVNVVKDERRREREGKPPRDRDARWGVKGTRRVKDGQGRTVKQKEYSYGDKAHMGFNAGAEIITSVLVTAANGHDGHQLPKLLEKDLALGLPVDTVAADRAYDDTGNHYLLKSLGLYSAISLNRYRTEKKDKNKKGWVALREDPKHIQGQKERYKIERKFGEGKQGHGLRRCRYLGLIRYGVQVFLTAMVLNLKRMVKLLTGANFKGRARVTA